MFQDLTDEQLDTLDGILKLQLNSTIGRFTHPGTSPRVKEKLKEHQVVLGDLLAGTGAERRARRVEREDGLSGLSDDQLKLLVRVLEASVSNVREVLAAGDSPLRPEEVGRLRADALLCSGLAHDFRAVLKRRKGEDRG